MNHTCRTNPISNPITFYYYSPPEPIFKIIEGICSRRFISILRERRWVMRIFLFFIYARVQRGKGGVGVEVVVESEVVLNLFSVHWKIWCLNAALRIFAKKNRSRQEKHEKIFFIVIWDSELTLSIPFMVVTFISELCNLILISIRRTQFSPSVSAFQTKRCLNFFVLFKCSSLRFI